MDMSTTIAQLARRFLNRPPMESDGLPEHVIEAAEARLGHRLPECLRRYYVVAGGCARLNSIHNDFVGPSDLEVDNGFLVFMHENQDVVSWGLRVSDASEQDPIVWQRINTPTVEWYSEEKGFVAFLQEMFEWYEESGVWTK